MQLQRNKMLNSLSSIPEDAMAANLTSPPGGQRYRYATVVLYVAR